MGLLKAVDTKLFRNVGIYTFGHILNAAIPFMLMPVLTRYLSPEDYGITAILGVLIGIYTPFVGVNLQGFVSVAYFKKHLDLSLVVSTAIGILFLSVAVTTTITIIGKEYISELTQFPVDWLLVVVVICCTNFFISLLQGIQQVKQHAKGYTIMQLGQTSMNLVFSLLFVVIFAMNWQGRVLAQVANGLIFMSISVVILRYWGLLKCRFDIEYMYEELKFGVPLIPHALSGYFVLAADRFFISHMVGLGEVGLFSVGFTLAQAIGLLGTSFNKAFSPWFFGKLKDFDEGKSTAKCELVKFSYACMAGFILIALVYSVCMPWFLSFFVGPKFQDASKYILSFALAAAINSIYYLIVNYIFYQQKTKYLAMITFSSGVMHIAITYFMIKTWGAIGAAYASVVTCSITTVATWWLSNKVYPMPWFSWHRINH